MFFSVDATSRTEQWLRKTIFHLHVMCSWNTTKSFLSVNLLAPFIAVWNSILKHWKTQVYTWYHLFVCSLKIFFLHRVTFDYFFKFNFIKIHRGWVWIFWFFLRFGLSCHWQIFFSSSKINCIVSVIAEGSFEISWGNNKHGSTFLSGWFVLRLWP